MKTIEEKAKAYDDLLVKLQKAKVDNNVCDDRYCCVIDDIVPELKESKDERIRKELAAYFAKFKKSDMWNDEFSFGDILVWLEKKGEQKIHTLEQAANIFLDALSNSPYNNKPITDAQTITKQLLIFLQDSASYNPDALDVNEQNPAWSEEDEGMLNSFLHKLEVCNLLSNKENVWAVRKLKSLKDRYTWKPSDEQMEALLKLEEMHVLEHEKNQENAHLYMMVKSIREQLLKLREE